MNSPFTFPKNWSLNRLSFTGSSYSVVLEGFFLLHSLSLYCDLEAKKTPEDSIFLRELVPYVSPGRAFLTCFRGLALSLF